MDNLTFIPRICKFYATADPSLLLLACVPGPAVSRAAHTAQSVKCEADPHWCTVQWQDSPPDYTVAQLSSALKCFHIISGSAVLDF